MSNGPSTPTLQDRVAIVTGASEGLGLEIVKQYVLSGASVMMCSRNMEKLGSALERLILEVPTASSVLTCQADVSRPTDVESLVRLTLKRFGRVDILVNNAGVYGPKGSIDAISWSDWVDAINVNLMGSVLMCREVAPIMKRKGYGKIVQLSGGGATNPMPNLSAYAVSKAAIVRFVETIALELAMHNIDVNAIAPGPLNTKMLDEVIDAGPERVGEEFFEKALQQKASGGAGLERGAKLAVFLGSAASDGISGKLISALWDPWGNFDQYKDRLAGSDIYTLRRIVPTDRGESW
tara:strand:+ start:966 stop:1847 length:882 start_codon:yes stop_codon:yes gene_type:complete